MKRVVVVKAVIEFDFQEVLEITTLSLPPGVVGKPYNVRLEAIGGDGVYRWRIVSGSLPEGLFLNEETGETSGVPRT